MSSLTPLEHTAIGGVAGVVEILFAQPTVYVKNCLQEGRSISFSPSLLYRGLTVNASAALPITACQFGMHRLLEQSYISKLGKAPNEASSIGIAMAAGASSALIGCPAEFVMIQQQRTGLSVSEVLQQTRKAYGISKIYKGLSATASREALYVSGYLGVAPIIRQKLSEIPAIESMPGGALVLSGVTAGLLATVASHPFDSVKTRMQAYPDNVTTPQYSSLVSSFRYSIKTEGVSNLFSGLAPRSVRLVLAVFILTGVRNTLIDVVEDSRN